MKLILFLMSSLSKFSVKMYISLFAQQHFILRKNESRLNTLNVCKRSWHKTKHSSKFQSKTVSRVCQPLIKTKNMYTLCLPTISMKQIESKYVYCSCIWAWDMVWCWNSIENQIFFVFIQFGMCVILFSFILIEIAERERMKGLWHGMCVSECAPFKKHQLDSSVRWTKY